MLNYDKLNGTIVSRETLEKIQNDKDVTAFYKYGETVWLDGWHIDHKNGNSYRVYMRGGNSA